MNKRKYREPSEATRQLMSIKKQGANNPMHNKHHSQESKARISQALKAYWLKIPSKNNTSNSL